MVKQNKNKQSAKVQGRVEKKTATEKVESLGWKITKLVFWLCVSVLMIVATVIMVTTLISESGI